MSVRVGINGMGRIGKGIVSAWIERNFEGIDIVLINDQVDAAAIAHLLKYDSVHGRLHADLQSADDNQSIVIGKTKKIRLSSARAIADCPWDRERVDIVLECTGKFRSRADAGQHLKKGVKKVILSAPGKDPDLTICMGINERSYRSAEHHILSNASCTTNCLASVAKVLHERFAIVKGLMTTIHSYTNDQKILDKYHKDWLRARAGALSMIPTSTGAAKSIGVVMPELKGKLDGMSVRVPTPNVSLVDLVVEVEKKTTAAEVNAAFREAAGGPLAGILACCEEKLVSIDFNGTWESAIVDTEYTNVLDGRLVKVLAWYDNETGFCHRMLDLANYVARQL